MAIKLNLNSKEILEMKFPNVPRGYDPLYVDEYLDKVIRDYKLVEANCLVEASEVDSLKARIATLEKELNDLRIEYEKYASRLKDINENDNVTTSNIDYIKRINVLEKFLYQHGYIPSQIK